MIAALRQSRAIGCSPESAIRDYIMTAYTTRISIGECIDFFCVDTPSIIDGVGYTESEQRIAVECFDSINHQLASKFYK